jgi:hypothetical protein
VFVDVPSNKVSHQKQYLISVSRTIAAYKLMQMEKSWIYFSQTSKKPYLLAGYNKARYKYAVI